MSDLDIPVISRHVLAIEMQDLRAQSDQGPGSATFNEALSAWRDGKHERTSALHQQALREGLVPVAQGVAHTQLAQIALNLDDLTGAFEHFGAVLKLAQATYDSVNDAAQYLGLMLAEVGRHEEASILDRLASRAQVRLRYQLSDEARERVRRQVRQRVRRLQGESPALAALMGAERSVRVFICSTFKDMQAERDELVKFVFPRLRRLCEDRGLGWADVDLRWGITDEERADGRVIPLCFAEIEKCHPFFIAILGDRYGWVPAEIPRIAVQDHPWLGAMVGLSVTELEIHQGVFRQPEQVRHAFCYLRNPAFVASLPQDKQSEYVEGPSEAEIETLGRVAAEQCAADRRERLDVLKQSIRQRGLQSHEDFGSPQELGRWVFADLEASINALFPKDSTPSPLDLEVRAHLNVALRHSNSFTGRTAEIARLDLHAAGSGAPIVVTGDSGSGKTALLATWASRHIAAHPSGKVLLHFVGAPGTRSDRGDVLQRLIREFARMFAIDEPVPTDAGDAERFFSWWLSLVSGRGHLILVIDGVDRMSGANETDSLRWLPPEMPPNVRLIVSASPPTGGVLCQRGWEPLRLTAFDRDTRRQVTLEFFRRYAKGLNKPIMEEIVDAPQSGSPLYLRALLDELRVFGFADRLTEIARRYLTAQSAPELFEHIFDRWESDYDRDRPNMVCDTLGLLAAARRGLSEPELLDLLGANGQPFPRGAWAPLLSALRPQLFENVGVLSLECEQFADAVQRRYFAKEHARRIQHERLAHYFACQPVGPRRVEEQPWHERLTDLNALARTLTDPDLMVRAWRDGRARDWTFYWGSLARHTDPVVSLQEMIAGAEADGASEARVALLCEQAAYLLHSLGRSNAALSMRNKAAALAATDAPCELAVSDGERALDELTAAAELADRGRACLFAGRYAEAKETVTRALGLLERMRGPNDVLVATSVNDLGEVYRRMGDPGRAVPLHERALRNRERALGRSDPEVAESLNNLGCALMDLGDATAAEAHLKRALAIRRAALGESHPLTADGFNNLGAVLTALGRPDEAIDMHQAALSSRRAVFGEDHPAVAQSHNNLGNAFSASGKEKEAAECFTRSLRIAELVHGPDDAGLLPALNNLATQYFVLGRRAEAIDLLQRAVKVAEGTLGPTHTNTELYRKNLERARDG